VTLDTGDGEAFVVQLVSPVEAGVLDGDIPKVSDESPLGRSLKGRRKGDTFKVEINGMTTDYTVKAIG
jgi:transcription elongation factor GreA